MEAVKKAEELINKFNTIKRNNQFVFRYNLKAAKDCALICVDEMLNEASYDYSKGIIVKAIYDIKSQWLYKVKEEIRNFKQ